MLETELKKGQINKQAQARKDLLYHDLKVVDSVLIVKKELEQSGKKIKSINNESQQYRNDRLGKQNNARLNSKPFMDAVIVVESNEVDPITGLKKEESIAVEYGD
jgi:hypothetical protein